MKNGQGTSSVAIVALIVIVMFVFLVAAYANRFFPFNVIVKEGPDIIRERETVREQAVPVPVTEKETIREKEVRNTTTTTTNTNMINNTN
ncbi:hypothetical protein HYU18_00135 [Candidatus Woesearchaeota archaeon]|nr:hypothetical protein [Candidatus Woesearchaeota archaeon]